MVKPPKPILIKNQPSYKLDSNGLLYTNNDNIFYLCSYLQVFAKTHDERYRNWGRVVELVNSIGGRIRIAIPAKLYSDNSKVIQLLMDYGLDVWDNTPRNRQLIINYISTTKTEKVIHCTEKPGWHAKHFISAANEWSDRANEPLPAFIIQRDYPVAVHVGVKGTLDEWKKEFQPYLSGNSRLLFAVGVALAAPVLEFAGEQHGMGFHLYGNSSIGKTTALHVAGSVLGGGGENGYLHAWRTTDNGLEYLAEAHNDHLLCLDEMGQLPNQDVGQIAYMLANGQGKTRSTAGGGLIRTPSWRLIFLSTGEVTLAEQAIEGTRYGRAARTGQETRLVDRGGPPCLDSLAACLRWMVFAVMPPLL